MKTQSTTSTRPEHKHSQASIDRAKQYAAHAVLSLILHRHYTNLAKSMKLRSAVQAAIQDYLNHEREFQALNKKL
jgi:hypothetical protein